MANRLLAGNWKMNGTGADLAELAAIAGAIPAGTDTVFCLPATLISRARAALPNLRLGGQNCHAKEMGAHTGEISAEMLRDAGAAHVILGHSERRAEAGETDDLVRAKAEAALRAQLIPIICIGESLAERQEGRAVDVVSAQLAGSLPDDPAVVVAYEPVFAIGTGITPSTAEIAEIHQALRRALIARFGTDGAKIPLLYGGSVKGANATGIFAIPDVNGALVGGASLKAADFLPILQAFLASSSN